MPPCPCRLLETLERHPNGTGHVELFHARIYLADNDDARGWNLLAVVAIENPGAVDRIRGWVAGGTAVLAYGSHVRADLLRAARDAGAEAVPNSEVERRLAALLTST